MKQKDETKNDTYYIKLTGKAEIPNKLYVGEKVGVAIEGAITAMTESDNHDGSFTYYSKFEPIIVKMVDEKGDVIHTKDIRKKSQQLRSAIWSEWNIMELDRDFDVYYNERMKTIIQAVINGKI